MARAPIIISNGGVITQLAMGCKNLDTDAAVEAKIKENVDRITEVNKNDTSLTKVVVIKKAKKNGYCLYWRLDDDDTKYNDNLKKYKNKDSRWEGEEGTTINKILDGIV